MEIEIISKIDNKLLERKEITAVVSFDAATPTRKEIRESVATKLGLDPGLTVLRSTKPQFGAKKIDVVLHSYANLERLKEVEPGYIRRRDGIAPPEEKKKEEKKGKAAPKK
ncbi:MAG: hypothetical protein QW590_02615 [Candidatus Bilamarchaeaceae archaeon]